MAQFKNLEFDGVDPSDHPDYSDAFVIYAEHKDGTPATEKECEEIEASDYYDEMYQTLIP